MVLQICEIKDHVSPGFSQHQLNLLSSCNFLHGTVSWIFTIPEVGLAQQRWGAEATGPAKRMVGMVGSHCNKGYKEQHGIDIFVTDYKQVTQHPTLSVPYTQLELNE